MEDCNHEFHTEVFSDIKTLEVLYKSSEPDEDFEKDNVVRLIINSDFRPKKWIHILTKL